MTGILTFFEDNSTSTATVDPNTALLFTAIFIVVAVVMIIFMIKGVERDKKKILQATATKDTMSPEMFNQLIARAYEKAGKKTRFTLYYIQLLQTADIISSFGKDVYDDALDKLMTRLENTFPWSVKICKYAEDAVAIFTTEPMNAKETKEHAEYIVFEAKKVHVMAANLRFNIDFNIGVNEKNEFSKTPEEFWQNTKIALEGAKKAGENTYALFSAELINKETEEYKFYQEIKQAIEDKEFELYYQPVVDLNSNETVGYESFLRWNHKTLGVLPPLRFLNILEQSGEINWVGIWAFEEMVKQYEIWNQGRPNKKLILSMNLSPKQLMNDSLVNEFRRILKKYRASAGNFCMEITEFVMFDKSEIFRNNVMKYRQAGFLIAIDSCGLEANSISMLEKIDLDVIKLDKDFLVRAENNFLLSNIMTMLHKYAEKKKSFIIAEKVENQEQLELTKKFEIPYAQGYFFSEPKAASEIQKG